MKRQLNPVAETASETSTKILSDISKLSTFFRKISILKQVVQGIQNGIEIVVGQALFIQKIYIKA